MSRHSAPARPYPGNLLPDCNFFVMFPMPFVTPLKHRCDTMMVSFEREPRL
jgi:hypothetical protein